MSNLFSITKKDKLTKARLGLLRTPHGIVKTPSYVIVATHAEVKTLKPSDIKKAKIQIVISNTYHLWEKALKAKAKGLAHRILKSNLPIMTDSGGFQVLSLAFGKRNKIGKFLVDKEAIQKKREYRREQIKITEKGVEFSLDGKKKFLSPEISMRLQNKIGGDIIFAFDDITSPFDTYAYNKKALAHTHAWAKKCLKEHQGLQFGSKRKQYLFGIVQGGTYKDLRIKSAKCIGSLPFDGFGIGGSYTKKQIQKTLSWVLPHLPPEKPRHLLGVGKVEDIFEAVEQGVDLFDCVIPTREARHGRIYSHRGYYDIRKSKYVNDDGRLSAGCKCPACSKNITKAKLQRLFKGKNGEAQRYATIHNVWFFNTLLENIRKAIATNKLRGFKKKFLRSFNGKSP